MKKKSLFLLFLYLFYSFICSENLFAQEKKQDECISIKADDMRKLYENRRYSFDNMFIFDIRPYSLARKAKRIPLVKLISRDMFKVKHLYTVSLWKGKDIYLVGHDTKSTKSFCEKMIEKDYGVRNIYYLEGGMDAWNGHVVPNFEKVECEGFTSRELIKMMESGRKVYFIDWRRPEHFFNDGHIPGAMNGWGREGVYGGMEDMLRGYFKFRPVYIALMTSDAIAVFIKYTEGGGRHQCRIERWASGIERMYYLKDGMEKWEGPLEKEQWKPPDRPETVKVDKSE